MYATVEKSGWLLAVWGDATGVAAVSTTAALLASGLAAREKKTLVITTDPGPYDAVSICSELVQENSLDDLLILASSGGLRTADDFTAYPVNISEYLSCLRGSGDLTRISISAADGLARILDMARGIYDFIIVDLYGKRGVITDRVLSEADLVVMCVSQNRKHIEKIIGDGVLTAVLQEKPTMMVITKFQVYPFFDMKQEEKLLKTKGCYRLSEDDDIYRAVGEQDVANYVFGHIDGETKGLLVKKRLERTNAMEELDQLLKDIDSQFREEPQKNTAFSGIAGMFFRKTAEKPDPLEEPDQPAAEPAEDRPFIHRAVREADNHAE